MRVQLEAGLAERSDRVHPLGRRFKGRPMSEGDKKATLSAAIREYGDGSEAVRRRAAGKTGGAAGAVEEEEEAALELERALHYNTGVAYWYLAEAERRKVTRLHCYNEFARALAQACQVQELQHLRDPSLKVGNMALTTGEPD